MPRAADTEKKQELPAGIPDSGSQCPVLTLRGLSPLSFQSWSSAPWGGWPRTTELRRAGNSLFCFTGVLNIYLYIYHISISVSLSSIYLSIYSSIHPPSHTHTSLPTYLQSFHVLQIRKLLLREIQWPSKTFLWEKAKLDWQPVCLIPCVLFTLPDGSCLNLS